MGCVGCLAPVGLCLLRGFVSLKFKNPQTHIFKPRGFVGLSLCSKIINWQPGFRISNAKIVKWLTSNKGWQASYLGVTIRNSFIWGSGNVLDSNIFNCAF